MVGNIIAVVFIICIILIYLSMYINYIPIDIYFPIFIILIIIIAVLLFVLLYKYISNIRNIKYYDSDSESIDSSDCEMNTYVPQDNTITGV